LLLLLLLLLLCLVLAAGVVFPDDHPDSGLVLQTFDAH
jgi:hypothetical protein